jgi:hypothetical protein
MTTKLPVTRDTSGPTPGLEQITIDVINRGIVQRVFEPADHTDRRVGDGLIHHRTTAACTSSSATSHPTMYEATYYAQTQASQSAKSQL